MQLILHHELLDLVRIGQHRYDERYQAEDADVGNITDAQHSRLAHQAEGDEQGVSTHHHQQRVDGTDAEEQRHHEEQRHILRSGYISGIHRA